MVTNLLLWDDVPYRAIGLLCGSQTFEIINERLYKHLNDGKDAVIFTGYVSLYPIDKNGNVHSEQVVLVKVNEGRITKWSFGVIQCER